MKRAVLYARVSDPHIQDADDKVSIDRQLADQRALCERNNWQIVDEFVDNENYKATQSPKRGKIVNPSGERADRPQFLKMLKLIKSGDTDIVLCWRDDRLVRHPRVAVALEDALDIGDTQRNGSPKIETRDATGARIDRFTLSIKATIWREENKRRAERTKMGKIATLQQGYWPGVYGRYGYKTRKAVRGRAIEVHEEEAQVVRVIYQMFDAGVSIGKIRKHLIASEYEQKGHATRRHDWHHAVIYRILRAEDYTGVATWHFGDGTEMSIEIPAIVDRPLWEHIQRRLDRNKKLSTRNAKGVYLLQGLIVCGDCGRAMQARQRRWYYQDGERRKRRSPGFLYCCRSPGLYPDEPHSRPYSRGGKGLDWKVWRHIVDLGIKRPELICEQVQRKQSELQEQGDDIEGEIAHAGRKLEGIAQERAFFQRQAARGKITEQEFDTRMKETEEARQHWVSELTRLRDLRDDKAKVQAGLDYATELLTKMQKRLAEIDCPPKELKKLSKEAQREILKERQGIIRALVDRVIVHANGRVEIEGVLDGSEAAQFKLVTR